LPGFQKFDDHWHKGEHCADNLRRAHCLVSGAVAAFVQSEQEEDHE
jgi:hypothetical protein